MARLGASIADYLGSVDPDTYLAECISQGYRAVPSPTLDLSDQSKIDYVRKEFARADILISETAAWVNALDPDPQLRKQALDDISAALTLAEELGAACCATVSGSYAAADAIDSHVGHHPDNFTREALDDVVEWVRLVLNDVKPTRTFLTLEMTPWAIVDAPEAYKYILSAVDHPGLAVHLDPANSITSPRAMFGSREVIRYLFEQLGRWVKACHAKDVTYVGSAAVVSIEEVPPGTGYLDYRAFLGHMKALDPDVPLIMEHLPSRTTYSEAASRVRAIADSVGLQV